MREKVTTLAEIAGAISIASGIGIIFGFGASLIAAGIFAITISYLAGE